LPTALVGLPGSFYPNPRLKHASFLGRTEAYLIMDYQKMAAGSLIRTAISSLDYF